MGQYVYQGGSINEKFIPVILRSSDECNIPTFLQGFTFYNLDSESGYQELYRRLTGQPAIVPAELGQVVPRAIVPTQGLVSGDDHDAQEHWILGLLRDRLQQSFYTRGPFVGEFGAGGGRAEDAYYYSGATHEPLAFKPAYYLTYWGWRATNLLLPNNREIWADITNRAIAQRFGGGRWIQVRLRDYTSVVDPERIVQTVRHTVRAAQILQLIGKSPSIAEQVALDLATEAPVLQNSDGGWKEFRLETPQPSSLYASLYVASYLATLLSGARTGSAFGPGSTRRQLSTRLQTTRHYLESAWRGSQWAFGDMPWEVNAPIILAEYATHAKDRRFLRQVRNALRGLLQANGRLTRPDIGGKHGAPEYKLSTRIAYALHAAALALNEPDPQLGELHQWLQHAYPLEGELNTCDLAFLAELLLRTSL
jgi:hypothetical protein